MDGRAADRQLQGPDRQAGDQAAAGHLLSCLAAAKACANARIKHEAAAAAPAAAGGRARAARHGQAPECRHGRSQPGMRADVTAALVEAHRDVEPSVAHDAPLTKAAASAESRGARA